MPRIIHAGFAAAAFLLAGVGAAQAQSGEAPPGFRGSCHPAPPLEEMLRRNDNVADIVNVSCDRLSVVVTANEIREVAFVRGGRAEVRFLGRWSEGTTFNVDQVQIGEQAPMSLSGPGRCSFYSQDGQFSNATCFARFERDGSQQAVVVMFGPE